MGHYDCPHCGNYGCLGDCIDEPNTLDQQNYATKVRMAKYVILRANEDLARLLTAIEFLKQEGIDCPYDGITE